jgi:hypothetical protein
MHSTRLSTAVRQGLLQGTLASAISGVALLLRGRADAGSAAAPINAISHWIWPASALRRDDASWRFTGSGAVTHVLASLFWAAVYASVREWRTRPSPANALTDAAAVAAAAAVVDFQVVPQRLTPGFEHRLSTPSLAWVYMGFAAGLALGGVLALQGRR